MPYFGMQMTLTVKSSPQIITVENLEGCFRQGDDNNELALNLTPRVSNDGNIVLFIDYSESHMGPSKIVGLDRDGIPIQKRAVARAKVQTTVEVESNRSNLISLHSTEHDTFANRFILVTASVQ